MKKRGALVRQIIKAWRKCINNDYPNRRINSERSLQASFWSRLNRLLPTNRLLFIEPRVLAMQDGVEVALFPDIVICNSSRVIGVIELKYQPRTKPSYTKDINSLAAISDCRQDIEIANERYLGEGPESKKFKMAGHVLFVWGGVHAAQSSSESNSDDLHFAEGKTCLDGCYLELHAVTQQGKKPDIYWRSSWTKDNGK